MYFFTNLCAASTVLFWKEFALAKCHLSELPIGGIIAVASLLALPMAFLLGRLSDTLGRRRAALIIYGVSLLGVTGSFTMRSPSFLGAGLLGAISGSWALPGLLNTVTAESFPTPLRGAAFAWANNLFGRGIFIAAPLLVGRLAGHFGWGPSVLMTVAGPLVALLILLRLLPTAERAASALDPEARRAT